MGASVVEVTNFRHLSWCEIHMPPASQLFLGPIRCALAALALLLATPARLPAAEPEVGREFVFERAPFAQCHAATLAEAGPAESPGTLVAAWFAGTREGNQDVGIWCSRREGGTWSAPQQVADGVQYIQGDGSPKRHPCWNPVLFQAPHGPLQLYYKCGPSPSTWWGMLTESTDGGKSWSTPRRLPERIDGPVKNKPVLLDDGRLLCASSTEDDGWRIHFEWTSDFGKTWTRVGPFNDGRELAAIQPAVLRHADRLQAVGRSKQGRVFSTWSMDGGRSWSAPDLLDLPNPNSGIDAVTLRDGLQVLVYNHTSRGRSPLNVAVSRDGTHWEAVAVLESEPGEYSYPAVIEGRDGQVRVAYTWRRERVRVVTLDPAKFQPRPIVEGRWPE